MNFEVSCRWRFKQQTNAWKDDPFKVLVGEIYNSSNLNAFGCVGIATEQIHSQCMTRQRFKGYLPFIAAF